MPVTEESVAIDRPQQEVWDFVDDPSNATMWQSNLEKFEQIDDGPRGVGTKFRGVTKVAGKRIEWTSEATEYDPPNRFAWESIEAPMEFTGSTTVEEVGSEACRVTQRVDVPEIGGFFGKLADPVVTRMYARDVRASLENLKEILESAP
jgi:uncharacterized membrane protein